MPSIGARGPCQGHYLNMRGTSLRLENTSLHREDFVRVAKRDAPAAEHDAHGTVPLGREVDRTLYGGLLDSLAPDPVVEPDFREHLRMFGRAFRFRIDLERREGDAFLSQDIDDVRGGARHRGEEHPLHGAGTPAGFRIARVEEDLLGSIGLRSKAHRVDVDQLGLHDVRRQPPPAAVDELYPEAAQLLFDPSIGWPCDHG